MKKLLLSLLFCASISTVFSQFLTDKKEVTNFEGYFNFHYVASEDKVYLEIDKLDIEFLYVHAMAQGLGSNDIGIDRGQLGNGVVVKFQKAGNKILLLQPNQKFRAITENSNEKNSIKEAFAKSILHGFKIIDTQNGVYLVDATDFFVRDAHNVAGKLSRNKQGSFSVDKSKSAFYLERTKAFSKNVEFEVALTFKGKSPGGMIRSVAPDATSVTVHQHHSFVELPDDSYEPRIFDPRSGGYPMSYMDYATPVNEPIVKRFIYRHRLEKKNPKAAISEAVEPIIYYLDPGAPEPIRSALLDGARWWNQAFEAIGYKDAFQVKILPEGADPLDLRYNVIQWVHRSTRGWSYGGSISDPRTGEIIKGHVSLGSLRIRQDYLIAQALQAPFGNDQVNDKFAMEMALARIRQLSAHEVGHTIGFAHNFAASTNNRASVMDYPHPQFSIENKKIDFSNAYAVGIGDWDKVTVAYAYQEFEGSEKYELQRILDDAFSSGLKYLSDSDARPKGSASADAHLWDNGSDVTVELENVLEVRKLAIDNFSADNIKSNEPFSVLEDVFVPLYFFHRYQTEAVVKQIGGLHYNYAVKDGSQDIVSRVDGDVERRALKTLLKTIDVEEIAIPTSLLELFPPRAIGYGRSRESFRGKSGVAFDPYGAVDTASELTLALLLHPERATRMVQHKSLDESQLGLIEVIDALISNSYKKTHKDTYFTELQNVVNNQVLNQLFYLAANDRTYFQVQAIVNFKIDEIEGLLKSSSATGVQKMYNAELQKMIKNFKSNPSKFKRVSAPKIPDGSPIGTTE
ncbi:zinc-dependent metalloprotease [Urechidicola vernalis]|uniref:Zinc-dependent metalloprotease n=1 Tax=Urechidicola vernalis TaxID=3075600 RepID=A0ABU2Y249_9FLAO|nr:zinc-dependent metalloprotease [Urechidicola sp. P050]MDT0551714.1 zinc-dependent metalloprotease [Urechidicola sp. P050]